MNREAKGVRHMPIDQTAPLDLSAIRAKLAGRQGPSYWRGLEELAGRKEFRDAMAREFPSGASEWLDPATRRTFLKLMAASLALAGLTGCSDFPQEQIVPYVNPPEDIIPGKPLFFASTMPFCGYGMGVLVETYEGRPTKIEGNPDHPASLGATNVFMQASVLDLYDPDRSQTVNHAGDASSWSNFLDALQSRLDARRNDATGVRLLTGTITSPSLAAQIQQLIRQYPGSRWHSYEPTSNTGVSGRAGGPDRVIYDFSKADVILSLDGDFLFEDAGSVAYARQFIDGRRRKLGVDPKQQTMNRLYVVESTFTLTGTMADHRRPVKPSQVEPVARAIATRLGVSAPQGPGAPAGLEQWIQACADDLLHPLQDANTPPPRGGVAVVVAGNSQPPSVHALARAMNERLGSVGKAVFYTDPVEAPGASSLQELVSDMAAGAVDTLFILGGNPAYDAPAGLDFAGHLSRLSTARNHKGLAHFTARLGMRHDETSFLCQWHVPETHYLEAWGDCRAFDGTVSIIQPLILPLYTGSKSAWEFVEALLGRPDRVGYEILRGYWQANAPQHVRASGSNPPTPAGPAAQASGQQSPSNAPQTQPAGPEAATGAGQPAARDQRSARDFDEWWQLVLRKGVIDDSAIKPRAAAGGSAQAGPATAPTSAPAGSGAASPPEAIASGGSGPWELVIRPDPTIWDGRFANNPWLQELPKFFSKLVWDNAAYISPRSAEELGVINTGDVVKITWGGRTLEVPVLIVPGVPEKTLSLTLGYGRLRAGHVANENGITRGYNAYVLWEPRSAGLLVGAEVARTGEQKQLVLTRSHHAMATLPGLDVSSETGILKPRAIENPSTDDYEAEVTNRRLVRVGNLQEFREEPDFTARLGGETELQEKGLDARFAGRKISLSLYPEGKTPGAWDYSKGYQWAMSIDQTACIGCNACVVACQAENNIPVVGKEEVARQREMHWIRIDDYFGAQPGGDAGADPLADPLVVHQPVPCMHCENAPCEYVCPVGATTHSVEGINEMTYNRCVGTRYCSNNCPYKVRRFNFFLYADYETATRKLQYNPDVTVRSRGVMEKSTYCVQRLNNTRMEVEKMAVRLDERIAKAAGPEEAQRLREMKDAQQRQMLAQLETACQQACPTEAIVFGDKNTPDSRISRRRADELDYSLLTDLNTRPRTTYEVRLRNPNPRLLSDAKAGGPQ
ncbi:MAG: Fe-S-cluster-containing hydrogenase subunit [Phycisphaerales bacterium]|nr:Fe-S-cluster-containing hydrogenase subunit [Phycisphaerales bacterium]